MYVCMYVPAGEVLRREEGSYRHFERAAQAAHRRKGTLHTYTYIHIRTYIHTYIHTGLLRAGCSEEGVRVPAGARSGRKREARRRTRTRHTKHDQGKGQGRTPTTL